MNYIATVNSRGQIKIPVEIRRKLKLHKFRKVLAYEKDGKLYLEPVQDLRNFKRTI